MKNHARTIIPHLWFDDRAEEAAELYTSLFENSQIGTITRFTDAGREVHGREEGQVMTVNFTLAGLQFGAINGGPHFSFTPAISFWVVAESVEEVDHLWAALSEGGEVLMDLDSYDWSERYGWLNDRYGLSWQIALGDVRDHGRKIIPSLLFVGDQNGRAEEAINTYTSVFDNSEIGTVLHYGAAHDHPGTVMYAEFTLGGQPFTAMDGGLAHEFSFSEAVSLLVPCYSQEEIDHYWERLSEAGDPSAQQCGWLKDRFGVSWQVTPSVLLEMLQDPDREKVERVTSAFMQMKKFDIAALEEAYAGRR